MNVTAGFVTFNAGFNGKNLPMLLIVKGNLPALTSKQYGMVCYTREARHLKTVTYRLVESYARPILSTVWGFRHVLTVKTTVKSYELL